ncbi:NUDIX domain-containing protein [Longispora fulva]|uniref:ADP-ribose pyrophosphatase YjhB (NUDIX family) n=1 Tax=Longispora fulva TaxID=619741 RepID=A0A8J7KPX9_9ACTN|nr:NUDIX domain-containing protein [Longispora fulva]MBG6136812.1 ADP-ribose pyrophosphatase YjhB (NUDIX family) [Longispora fulva]
MAHLHALGVLIILTRDEEVLLTLHKGTGQWSVPSGPLVGDENVLDAAVREAREKVDVQLTAEELEFVGVIHRRHGPERANMAFVFHALNVPELQGEPVNADPERCAEIRWFPMEEPPEKASPNTVRGLELLDSGESLSVADWEER